MGIQKTVLSIAEEIDAEKKAVEGEPAGTGEDSFQIEPARNLVAREKNIYDLSDLLDQALVLSDVPVGVIDDMPGSVMPTIEARQASHYGRISGNFFLMPLMDRESDAAPIDAVILPETGYVKIEPGESLRVHAQGWKEGGKFSAPRPDRVMDFLIEAGQEGFTFYGPATISRSEFPSRSLARVWRYTKYLNSLKSGRPSKEGDEHPAELKLGFELLITLGSVIAAGLWVSAGHRDVAAICAIVAAAGGFHIINKALKRSSIEVDLPAAEMTKPDPVSAETRKKLLESAKRLPALSKKTPASEDAESWVETLQVTSCGSSNFFPARQIEILPGREPIRLMRVLAPINDTQEGLPQDDGSEAALES